MCLNLKIGILYTSACQVDIMPVSKVTSVSQPPVRANIYTCELLVYESKRTHYMEITMLYHFPLVCTYNRLWCFHEMCQCPFTHLTSEPYPQGWALGVWFCVNIIDPLRQKAPVVHTSSMFYRILPYSYTPWRDSGCSPSQEHLDQMGVQSPRRVDERWPGGCTMLYKVGAWL